MMASKSMEANSAVSFVLHQMDPTLPGHEPVYSENIEQSLLLLSATALQQVSNTPAARSAYEIAVEFGINGSLRTYADEVCDIFDPDSHNAQVNYLTRAAFCPNLRQQQTQSYMTEYPYMTMASSYVSGVAQQATPFTNEQCTAVSDELCPELPEFEAQIGRPAR